MSLHVRAPPLPLLNTGIVKGVTDQPVRCCKDWELSCGNMSITVKYMYSRLYLPYKVYLCQMTSEVNHSIIVSSNLYQLFPLEWLISANTIPKVSGN